MFQIPKSFLLIITLLTHKTVLIQLADTCLDIIAFNNKFASELENKSIMDIYSSLDDNSFKGKGGNGKTYKINWGSEEVALKIVKVPNLFRDQIKEEDELLADELNFLEIVNTDLSAAKNSPPEHVPKYLPKHCTYLVSKSSDQFGKFNIYLFIIQELLKFDLTSKNFLDIHFSNSIEKRSILYRNLFLSLKDIHNHKIVHNDIKPANLMMKEDGTIKIIDFGLSGFINTEAYYSTKCLDFPKQMIKGQQTTTDYMRTNFDIYSMAITIAMLEINSKSSFMNLCETYINAACYRGNKSYNCLFIIKDSVFGVMNRSFGTQRVANLDYNINDCTDVGCIVMSCVTFQCSNIPTLKDIDLAFERIFNPQVRNNVQTYVPLRKIGITKI